MEKGTKFRPDPNLKIMDQVRAVLRYRLHSVVPKGLMAKLLYGSGLRLMECIRMRIRDVDF